MKLFKVHIKKYHFGISYYDLFILADSEDNMFKTVCEHPSYRKDKNAGIMDYKEIDLNDPENRVL